MRSGSRSSQQSINLGLFPPALPTPEQSYKKKGRRNYDAVVYSVGTAVVILIILAFVRGFYRLKLDRKRFGNPTDASRNLPFVTTSLVFVVRCDRLKFVWKCSKATQNNFFERLY